MVTDAEWMAADSATDFVQQLPTTGAASLYRTVARVLYDADHVYVSAVNYDPSPGLAITAGLQRDFVSGNSDAFAVALGARPVAIDPAAHDRLVIGGEARRAAGRNGPPPGIRGYLDGRRPRLCGAVADLTRDIAAPAIERAACVDPARVPVSGRDIS